MNKMNRQTMTVEEAAKYAKVCTKTIYNNLKKTKKLDGYYDYSTNNSGRWIIYKDSLESLYYGVNPGVRQNVQTVKPIKENKILRIVVREGNLLTEEQAIQFLKERGYKILKPVITHEEI
jgi:hypothetical protein